MSINIGSNKVKAISAGSNKIKAVYVGSTKVWSAIRGIIAIATSGVSSDYVDEVYVSTDLATPVSIKLSNIRNAWRSSRVACSKSRFVLIIPNSDSDYAGIHYSYDGVTWTPILSSMVATGNDYPFDIKYFEEIDKFVAFYYQYLYLSSDGINWTGISVTGSSTVTDVVYGEGYILIIPYNGYQILYNVSDGTTSSISAEAGRVGMVVGAYGKGKFVAYEYGKGFSTLDLSTKKWTLVSNILTTASTTAISMIFANGMFLVGTLFSGNFYSYDGITWNAYTPPKRIFKISHDGDKFLGTSDNAFGYSYDGINWTYVTVDDTQVIAGGIAGN
ncbi:hypothetical protein [Anaerosporobacter faecicola]|uniref:hypothetical protein n=1 Tax=Anaerosporobacter faecicola TaxID=2718714 RepID=UPI00143ADE6F|nr:hypothetical protein [Anaerosporobacter faecicola]